jgi:preprotein translocase subunit SecA
MPTPERQIAYQSDVVYVTNNEIGFDYLRDNMVVDKKDRVLRSLDYAIVDEVDSILIDEARTPLIISGPSEEYTNKYYIINRLIPQLRGRKITENEEIQAKYKGISLETGYDYLVDEKNHSVTLTDEGIKKCERLLGLKSLYDDVSGEWVHHITQAVRAHNLFHRDTHYVVKDGQVIIVDEFTGRLMPGRRWSEGLHQAIEAKEHLQIAEENQTLATITFQNFFRMYKKLSGMTGTAMTEAPEFWQIYKLDVVAIPPNRPLVRKDHADVIYRTEREKINAIIKSIEELYRQGQPVLVGTRSIEKSEKLSNILRQKGIPHQVLNAKYHEQEAQIIAQAGRKSAVTIATNMAGRGTDIVLGGNPPNPDDASVVKQLGGLHILGTERHEARRIDNQLRGRSGRQGDPGSSRFYLSLEDELMRLFGSERISNLMLKMGMTEGEEIQHPWITKAIENAQRRVEAMNFDIRKQLLEYDNVMNKQRQFVYSLRDFILDGEDVSARIQQMLEETVQEKISAYTKDKYCENWLWPDLETWLYRQTRQKLPAEASDRNNISREKLTEVVLSELTAAYGRRKEQLGQDVLRQMERFVLLQLIDHAWKDHLYELDQLRKGIGLRAYGQKDPLQEYQQESFNLFEQMMDRIRENTIDYIFHVEIPQIARAPVITVGEKPSLDSMPSPARRSDSLSGAKAIKPEGGPWSFGQPSRPSGVAKIGRNDPCPCGSGKKYKKCCGKNL